MDGRPWKLGSCGIPLSGYELKAADDDGKILPANQVGEIIARGPMLDCYYNNAEATAQISPHGWEVAQ